jgi:hypothetical protein
MNYPPSVVVMSSHHRILAAEDMFMIADDLTCALEEVVCS